MKLRNKKTGEIGFLVTSKTSGCYLIANDDWLTCGIYKSLTKLNEEWENVPEESKEYWFIGYDAQVECISEEDSDGIELDKEIGNYFETKEEAEKAVEKLKAWKRLKDEGIRFNGWYYSLKGNRENLTVLLKMNTRCKIDNLAKDLDLLFGGEE